jgi:hypothetical protein
VAMADPGPLRERDLRVFTAVIEDGRRDDPGEAMPCRVVDRRHCSVPSKPARYEEIDVPGHLSAGGR